MSVPPGLPIFVDELCSHLNHGFLMRYSGSPWPPSFSVCVCSILVSSLVMELSSVYSSSIMVKDFFEFFFLEVLEPVSLGMPLSWGFFSQIFFRIFFPCTVSFFLSGTLMARMLDPFYCPTDLWGSACWCPEQISYRLAFQLTHLSSVISDLLETPSVTFLLLWFYSSVLKLPFHPSSWLLFPHWDF